MYEYERVHFVYLHIVNFLDGYIFQCNNGE